MEHGDQTVNAIMRVIHHYDHTYTNGANERFGILIVKASMGAIVRYTSWYEAVTNEQPRNSVQWCLTASV